MDEVIGPTETAAGQGHAPDPAEWGHAALWPPGARSRGLVWLVAVFCAYVGVALLYPFTEAGGVALLWMPNAVLVTALLRFRPQDWAYVYLTGLLAEVVGDLPFNMAPQQALYFGLVNAVESTLFVLCASLIAGGRTKVGLLSVRGVAGVVLASVMVPASTGAIGAIGSVWTFGADYFTAWRAWWFGDGLGLLVGVPVGLLLRDAGRSVALRRPPAQTFGIGGAAAIMMAVAGVLAASGNAWGAQQTALASAILLALTFGAVGAPAAALLTATVTLVGLARDEGFASAAREQALLFVVFAAIYSIAATSESADQAMRQLSRATAELDRLARFDALTGLVNRREALARLESTLTCARTPGTACGVLFCDVDKFKVINDTWGHAAGDAVLSAVARRVCQSVRHADTVGRAGGDEILVLLPGVHSLDEVALIAQKIQTLAAEPIQYNGTSIHTTLSMGATLAIPGETVASATARADAAMYEAKRQGGNATHCI